ncbi:hypothetical protein [Burkholderia stagnalis]|uniref:hypothetical protein n=1 Tax=Burkholderia stagnalis TaxID=1503054 RepID=UPI000AEB5A98|nr:hypothetical protein [Burkholderia stagnalis]
MSIYVGEKVRSKCPKCGSKDLIIDEVFEGVETFTVVDGVITEFHGLDDFGHPGGDSTGCFRGKCSACKHEWRFRKSPIPA